MATLTEFPKRFAAGTTVKLTLSFPDYPASAWGLTLLLNGPAPSTLSVAGVPNGDAFDVTLTATATANLVPGTYRWTARVTQGVEKYDALGDMVVITANAATAAAGAFLSFEEKTLAVIEAAISGTLTKGQQSYQIDGIAVERLDFEQLEQLRVKYQTAVNRLRNRGRGLRTHRVRFSQES